MMASQFTEEAVQGFLSERGGRVQQMELMDHFLSHRGCNNDQSDEGVYREVLRRIVDSVCSVKVEDGVKYVCLNAERSAMLSESGGPDQAECNGNIREALDNKHVNGNPENGVQTEAPLASLDNNKQSNGNENDARSQCRANARTPAASTGGGEVRLRDRRRRESAPVIAIQDLEQGHPAGPHGQQVRGARRISKGSQRAILTSCLSEDSALEGLESIGDIQTPKGSRRNFIELMMSTSPQVRRSLINRGPRVRDSLRSEGDSASLLSSATDEDCAMVTLDPLEHEWMLCASDGMWESLQPLLAVEPSLVAKRDFVTGFTCLHWAAKQGKAELLSQLLTFAKKNAIPLNVNVRSSAGYTPLHLAAMHGHTQVVRLLLCQTGRRTLKPGITAGGEPSSTCPRRWLPTCSRKEWVLQANLNPLRRLNLSAEATEEPAGNGKTKGGLQRKTSLSRLNAKLHRGRQRAQIIHSASFRDSGEVEIGEDTTSSPLRTRPLSSLFG
ncbi:hypothetical protein OJAV_G00206190 [Oryzias javanicus]|uniref:SOWAHA-C winged helix-turn-helix domain-containing protein n=1 Tax=Oryzias javanicus TaxID=123683 RepID=A0A3S2NWC7_ORYJA|nr:hypothetical protein OJAV_G00206190 [Oryzias javanicus]